MELGTPDSRPIFRKARKERRKISGLVAFNCHLESPEKRVSVREGLSRSGWPAGVSWGVVLIILIDVRRLGSLWAAPFPRQSS